MRGPDRSSSSRTACPRPRSPLEEASDETLDTFTHARLRAEQGDVAAAVRLLHRLLARGRDVEAARRLLARLGGSEQPHVYRRIARLERWLSRIRTTARLDPPT